MVGLPLAFMQYGVAGAIVFVVIGEIFRYIPILVGLIREGFSFVKQDVAMTLLMLGLAGLWGWLQTLILHAFSAVASDYRPFCR